MRWIGPLAALARVRRRRRLSCIASSRTCTCASVFEHLHAIPRRTCSSPLALHRGQLLAARLLRRAGAALPAQGVVPYARILFTSFIAYSFGHTLGFAAFTGAAIRFRLYATAGVTAIDVATVTGFCSLRSASGSRRIAGLSLLLAPAQAAAVLHLHPRLVDARRRRAARRGRAPTRCGRARARHARDPRLGAARARARDRPRADRARGARPEAVQRGAVVAAAAAGAHAASSPSSAPMPRR